MNAARELDYTRHYRWWHDESDAHFEHEVASAGRWLSPYWPRDKAAPIVDIGCGMGFVVGSFVRAGFSFAEGIDADAGQVRSAQARRLPVSHVPVTDTLTWMNERRGRYALVTAIDVLEHIPRESQLDFLEGVRRILRPGGTFLCRVPNANSAVSNVYRYIDWTHHFSFTQFSLDFVLHNAGFSDIDIAPTPPFPLFQRLTRPGLWLLGCFRAFRRLEMIAEFGWAQGREAPLTQNIVAIAKKAPSDVAMAGERRLERSERQYERGGAA
jgi:SAM-dependent methyltransferase